MSALIMIALAAVAPEAPEPCRDDKGQDRCDTAIQTQMRDRFGLKPIATLAAAGSIVRRVMYVDGYGRDLVAIEFVRAVGSDPMVRVSLPAKGPQSRGVMEAAMSAKRWTSIIDGSRQFHRSFAPLAKGANDDINICLHSWVYTVEAADPDGRPLVRRAIDDACQDGPAAQFASLVAKEALTAFPVCAALDRRHHRNEATMLATCFRLKGDRLAAAELFNRTEGLGLLSRNARAALGAQSYYNVTVDWDGTSAKGTAAKNLINSKLVEGDNANLYIRDVTGRSPRSGTATGELVRYPSDGKGPLEAASVALDWDLQWGQPITSIRIGPWQARTPASE